MTRPLPLDRGDGAPPSPPCAPARRRSPWITGLAAVAIGVAAACIGAAGYAWWPLREAFYTDAETIREDQATARVRDVLWEPVRYVEKLAALGTDIYEPRISADGSTLFFVRGKAGGNAEIFTARRTLDGWVEARPLEDINTADDDLGPQPSPDGRYLYFYSNRVGGLGGYDLWVARRLEGEEIAFAEPTNLGPAVNSPFNEYGPAIAPSGDLLYFASNRPQPGDADQPEPNAWPGTVREDLFHRTYDLYVAAFGPSGATSATPLTLLNTPWNEGSPAVTPTGDFLYFASDRPGGSGAFDLYRSRRIQGVVQPAENLGPTVNSSANDLDPALGMGGFALLFSSDRVAGPSAETRTPSSQTERTSREGRVAGPPAYQLYSTTSREVFLDARSYSRAFDWAAFWWRLGTALLWALLALLLLLALLALARDMQQRRLSLLARCLLASMVLHLALLLLLSVWQVTASVLGPPRPGGGTQVALAAPAQAQGVASQIRGSIVETVTAALPAPSAVRSWVPRVWQEPPLTLSAVEAPAPLAEVPVSWTPPSVSPQSEAPSSERGVPPLNPALPMTESGSWPDVALPEALRPGAAAESRDVSPEIPVEASMPRVAPPPRFAAAPREVSEVAPLAQSHRVFNAPQAEWFAGILLAEREAAPPSTTRTPRTAVEFAQPPVSATEIAVALPRDVAQPVPVAEPEDSGANAVPVTTGVSAGAPPRDFMPSRVAVENVTIEPPRGEATEQTEPLLRGPALEPRTDVLPEVAMAKAPLPGLATSMSFSEMARGTEFRLPEVPSAAALERGKRAEPPPETALSITAPVRAQAAPVLVAASSGTIVVDPLEDDRPPRTAPNVEQLRLPAPEVAAAPAALNPARDPSFTSRVEISSPSLPTWSVELETQPHVSAYPQRVPDARSEMVTPPSREDLENAVAMALRWLADHQGRDGRWDGKAFDTGCGRCGGEGTADTPLALTALSMLAFQASGHDHIRPGPFRKALDHALPVLLLSQSDSGEIGGESLYTHALATLALADALAMSGDPRLRRPLVQAVRYLETAGDSTEGGWSAEIGQPADTAVTGWVVHALAAAQVAGVEPSAASLDRAADWLNRVSSRDLPGAYGFQPDRGFTPAMTAEGLFARQLLGRRPDEPLMRASAALVQRERVDWSTQPDTYFWYFATLALREHGGDAPGRWVASVRQELLENQERDGAARGSWNPAAPWSQAGGRVYQTALGALILQSSWRYPFQAVPLDSVPIPDDAVGVIRGTVVNADSGTPLSGATVRLDLADRPAVQVETDVAGRYLLYTPELPPFFALTAVHAGYTPKSVNASSAILLQPGRSFREGVVVDFTLEPERESVVSIEAVPELHHLGDDRFDGRINSRFQKSAEGSVFQATFTLTSEQLPPRFTVAELRLLVKGVQYPHRFYINDVLLDEPLDESPEDGSFGEFTLSFDPGILSEGPNGLMIRAGGRPGDVDDFEFVNLTVYLSR